MPHSLWTDADQKALSELVRKRGFADVVLGLKQIAWGPTPEKARSRARRLAKGEQRMCEDL